jgi:hypothetical protein
MDGKIVKIVSGGQTGADRAALDSAIEPGIEYGGWRPQNEQFSCFTRVMLGALGVLNLATAGLPRHHSQHPWKSNNSRNEI